MVDAQHSDAVHPDAPRSADVFSADVFSADVWRSFLEQLRDSAPDGTRETTFVGHFSPSSWGGMTLDDGSSDARRVNRRADRARSPIDTTKALRAAGGDEGFFARVRVVHGRPGLAAEVDVIRLPRGVHLGVGSHDTSEIAFDPDDVPEPYRREPDAGAAEPSAAADPQLVAELVRAALPGAVGATADELSRLARDLPADVAALYTTAGEGDLILSESSRGVVTGAAGADAVGFGAGADDDAEWSYVMRIVGPADADARSYLSPRVRAMAWRYGAREVLAPDPFERVQPLAASPAWFQIGDDWGGSAYVVDLAPGPRGTVGQVLFVDRDTISGARWVAPSLTEFLVQRPASMAPLPDAADRMLVLRAGTPGGVSAVTAQTEVLVIGAVDEPLDFAVLHDHPRLRTLSLAAGRAVDLDVLKRMPALEYLELSPDDWGRLLDAGAVPSGLRAAGILDPDVDTHVDVLTRLAALRGVPGPEVTRLNFADGAAHEAPAGRGSWWRRLLGR